ncbi:MAG: hypothetical protein EPO26_13480 [Chloroflexota bacterium]|nr:MAG: hypothetical protein EPO26_13480 [Chloroflexota bacterium]
MGTDIARIPLPARVPPRGRIGRTIALTATALAVATGVLATGFDASSATAAFLSQFRVQRVAPIAIDHASVTSAMESMGRLGTVTAADRQATKPVELPLAEASARAGLAPANPPTSAIPAGLARPTTAMVSSGATSRFRFEKARADQYLREIGRTDFAVADRFDGATLVVTTAPILAQRWQGAKPEQSLMIVQSRGLDATVEGRVTFDEFRDLLLSVPGMPADVVRQLRALRDWRTTLPVPIPPEMVSREVAIGATTGIVVDGGKVGAAVIWPRDGEIRGVMGSFPSAEIVQIARSIP